MSEDNDGPNTKGRYVLIYGVGPLRLDLRGGSFRCPAMLAIKRPDGQS